MKLNKKVRKFAYASTVVVGALTPYLISGGIVKAETPQDNPVETSEKRTGNGIPEDLQETYLAQIPDALPAAARSSIFNPRLSVPTTNDAYYFSYNPFYLFGYGMPNCTAYAWGKAYEILGSKPDLSLGNANQWWGYNAGKYASGKTPRVGSVVCWGSPAGGGYGHVAVVEEVNGDALTISESSWGGSLFRTRKINKNNMGAGFQGYIYLGDFSNKSNTLGDWVTEKTWSTLNIGIWDYYTTAHTLRWQYYDLDKKEWHELQRGASNWTSLAVPKGNYWVKVDILDQNNNVIESKTMGTDGATKSVIDAVNVTRESNGDYLLGAISNNPYMSYVAKLYNYQTGQWFTQFNSQWARFRAQKGVKYRVQFEIYGWNRCLDFKGYDFIG
ncbi:MAG: CHAP domain-containing protein [Lactococcus raffinolactis]|nr:CHAP domain-containing protein [Lactococcus raffinolactis]MDN5579144.1 CHAP domain-containing protein [Lactococcus raffinolactis]MDN6036569.1 CHAP domain-containing protein [Lactococcus raffinolactis]MDN6044371.1 CHAP domain-containing protein [Lactococcus raffinolactis]MDN6082221.1 CHAP domain-containing protein [Lactococcus raffinolactis]